MKCIVTGGAGFIGSNLALHLENEGHEVIVIDNFSSASRNNLKGFKGRIVEQDVSELSEFNEKVEVIFHQAAITDPRYPDDEETIHQNVKGFKNIIKLAKKNNARLIYASSASMYGNGPSPQKENQEKDILSAYAKSKLMMDEITEREMSAMHIVGLRYFNVFGPHEAHKGRPASMIYHLAKQIKAGKNPKIFRMGEQRRDHIHVKDCVEANIKALSGRPGIYNIGTGVATSFNQVVQYINEGLGTNLEPEYIDNPYEGTYQNHTQADITKAKQGLDFSSQYPIKDAIAEYVKKIE